MPRNPINVNGGVLEMPVKALEMRHDVRRISKHCLGARYSTKDELRFSESTKDGSKCFRGDWKRVKDHMRVF